MPSVSSLPIQRLANAASRNYTLRSHATTNYQLRIARRLKRKQRFADATQILQRVLSVHPSHVAARQLAADIFLSTGQTQHAASLSHELLRENPLDLRSISRLRVIGQPTHSSREAAFDYLERQGRSASTLLAAAKYLNGLFLYDDAAEVARAGAELAHSDRAQRTALLYEWAFALAASNQFADAIRIFEQMPYFARWTHPVSSEYARCLLELGRLKEAKWVLWRHAISFRGSRNFNVIFQSLQFLSGNIGKAHLLYRYSARSAKVQKSFGRKRTDILYLRLLKSANRSRSAFVVSSWGPGDEIRFASMYEEVGNLFAEVTITCDPRLRSLLVRSFPRISFLPVARYRKQFGPTNLSGRETVRDERLATFLSNEVMEAGRSADVVLTDVDMLADLRQSRRDFLNGSRLSVDARRVERWEVAVRKNGEEYRQVGLAWRSMLRSPARERHYLDVADMRALEELDGVKIWILQAGMTDEEREAVCGMNISLKIPNIDLVDDFEEQAALLSVLDAFVGPLSTMTELAGMVGTKPLLLARTHTASWRRNPDGSDVWYPEGKLVIGDPIWDRDALMKEVVRELQALRK